MKQVFIQVSAVPTEPFRWLLRDTSTNEHQLGSGPVAALAPLAHGRQVILRIPGEHVVLTELELAIRQPSKLRKAIPYALEDQFSEDVENLHFAHRQDKQGKTHVAVINGKRLASWVEQLTSEGITPRHAITDTLALPWTKETWSILLEGNRATVRTGEAEGFNSEREGLEEFLTAILETHPLPKEINTWYCSKETRPLSWSTSAPPITQTPCEEGTLRIIAEDWQAGANINLLQGAFSAELNLSKHLKPWRWVAALLVLWTGLATASQVLEKQQLQTRVDSAKNQMVSIYRQSFPEARKVPNPRVQMEQKLKTLRGGVGASDSDFLALLGRSAQPIAASSATALEGINYRSGKLTLQLSAKSLGDLERLKEQIDTQEGIAAKLIGADSSAGKATGQVRISVK